MNTITALIIGVAALGTVGTTTVIIANNTTDEKPPSVKELFTAQKPEIKVSNCNNSIPLPKKIQDAGWDITLLYNRFRAVKMAKKRAAGVCGCWHELYPHEQALKEFPEHYWNLTEKEELQEITKLRKEKRKIENSIDNAAYDLKCYGIK